MFSKYSGWAIDRKTGMQQVYLLWSHINHKVLWNSINTKEREEDKENENLHRWRGLFLSDPSLLHEFKCRRDKDRERGKSDVTFSGPLLFCALSIADGRTQHLRSKLCKNFHRLCYQLLRFNKMVSKYWLYIVYTLSIKVRFISYIDLCTFP